MHDEVQVQTSAPSRGACSRLSPAPVWDKMTGSDDARLELCLRSSIFASTSPIRPMALLCMRWYLRTRWLCSPEAAEVLFRRCHASKQASTSPRLWRSATDRYSILEGTHCGPCMLAWIIMIMRSALLPLSDGTSSDPVRLLLLHSLSCLAPRMDALAGAEARLAVHELGADDPLHSGRPCLQLCRGLSAPVNRSLSRLGSRQEVALVSCRVVSCRVGHQSKYASDPVSWHRTSLDGSVGPHLVPSEWPFCSAVSAASLSCLWAASRSWPSSSCACSPSGSPAACSAASRCLLLNKARSWSPTGST